MQFLDGASLEALSAQAAASPRLRTNRNFHSDSAAAVQRLAIAMEPGTYVRPHRHEGTWELLMPLSGAFELIEFDETGTVRARYRMGEGGAAVLEMPAGTWHSVIALKPGSVVFEVKEGPYLPPGATKAAWSPEEGDVRVPDMMAFLTNAAPGERFGA